MTTQPTQTPEQLRVQCAEAMGYVEGQRYYGRRMWSHPNIKCWFGLTEQDAALLPNYPADLNAAITLCDHLKLRGWRPSMRYHMLNKWECAFWKPGTCLQRSAEADTLPLAICRAFLLTLAPATGTNERTEG